MMVLKKLGLMAALAAGAGLSILIYSHDALYHRAKREMDPVKKIAGLERAGRTYPLNDLVFYELGKTHFILAQDNAGDPVLSGSHLRQAAANLEKALGVNPYSPYAHYYLGQAKLQLEVLAPADGRRPFAEFRKAAMLAGGDHQIVDEVGKMFFSRWPELGEDDRRFSLDLARDIMASEDAGRMRALLRIWELNIADPEIIGGVLNEDAQVYRIYADYLGERSLFPEARRKYLAGAERLEFEQARTSVQSGEYALFRLRREQAYDHFSRAETLLRGVRFYQVFQPDRRISDSDHLALTRRLRLGLAKCRIEQGAKLDEVETDLYSYLSLEDRPKEVAALEAYLRARRLLPEDRGPAIEDLRRLALELQLQYQQARYREIVSFGRALQKSLIVVPDDQRRAYAQVLRLIGDSLQKVDFIYDAVETFRRALEIDPEPLRTLLRLRESYERLNDDDKARQVAERIRQAEAPAVVDLGQPTVARGDTFSRSLLYGGEAIVLEIRLKVDDPAGPPAVSVFFNGRVVWEAPPLGEVISLRLETKPGQNLLEIAPLNRKISLAGLSWRPVPDPTVVAIPPGRRAN